MKCRTCNFQNESPSNFCASCGAALTNTKTPTWLWIMILFFTVACGGLGYVVYEAYEATQQAETLNAEIQPVQKISEETTSKDENATTTDRISLIKDIQQKVFTIVTTYGHGSGFLYAKGGYVVTNAHVVDGEIDVTVRNSNGQEYAAKVIGISDQYDIALLYVPDYNQAEPIQIEKEESPIGLEVIAFGSPQGLENTAAPGYITGHDRDMQVDRFIYKQIYQLDAQVDQGSSGGPLIDATSGKVVGINSLLFTSETSTNFAFSIPVYSMLEHFDQWMKSPMTKEQILAAAGYYDTYNPPTADYEQEEEHYEEEVEEEIAEEEVYEEPVYEEDNSLFAGQFVQSFRMYYEQSLNTGEFYWIADMLTGNAYAELEEYVADIAYNGHTFEFLGNDILSVNYNNGAYLVKTNETFDFYPADGNYEYFDRFKTYTVLEDEYGAFKISTIKIHE